MIRILKAESKVKRTKKQNGDIKKKRFQIFNFLKTKKTKTTDKTLLILIRGYYFVYLFIFFCYCEN